MIVKQTIFEIVFWFSAGIILYVYVIYPLVLSLVARRRDTTPLLSITPRVSLLISAYNESGIIEHKLRNALSLDYPRDLLDIVVISDCSDDGTDELVAKYAPHGVRLLRQPQRLGKSSGLNLGVAQAFGEILVFSDANAIYEHHAIPCLVRHFADPQVGYVVGNARYTEGAGQPASAKSESLYWKLETWLKEKESQFGSVVGGDGAIYAIRRELFTPLEPTDISDFLNPLQIIVRGYRGVYEPHAISYEEPADTFEKEFARKIRIVSRSLNALRRAPAVLLPWKQPRHWLALVSHKVLRWLAPVFLALIFLASLLLWPIFIYRLTAFLQAVSYVLAASGWAIRRHRKVPNVLLLPYYFCLVNLASLLGLVKFVRGSLSPTWQTIRQQTSGPEESIGRP